MSVVMFLGVLLGIVLLAVAVNRMTGTRAHYVDALQLEPGEKELWRDAGADFAVVQRMGRALKMSYARLRRTTVIWTDRRIVIAVKPLFSDRCMITHQIYFDGDTAHDVVNARQVAAEAFGGFFGRGFQTISAQSKAFGQVNNKNCVRIRPTEACGASKNINEMLIFTDQIDELQRVLAASL